MRRRNIRSAGFPFILLLPILFTGILIGGQFSTRASTTEVRTCTISSVIPSKDGFVVWSSCPMMFITADVPGGQWLPYERAGQLEKGKTYEITTAGIVAKNIIKIEPSEVK